MKNTSLCLWLVALSLILLASPLQGGPTTRETESSLAKAVDASDEKEVIALLEAGADVNAGRPFSPLWIAARNGDVKIAKVLIDHGARVNASEGRCGKWPLWEAVCNRHVEMVTLLLEKGADSDPDLGPSRNLPRPLSVATMYGDNDIVRALVAKGANVNNRVDSRTPLEDAVYSRHIETVRLLLKLGADPNIENKAHRRPIDLVAPDLTEMTHTLREAMKHRKE